MPYLRTLRNRAEAQMPFYHTGRKVIQSALARAALCADVRGQVASAHAITSQFRPVYAATAPFFPPRGRRGRRECRYVARVATLTAL